MFAQALSRGLLRRGGNSTKGTWDPEADTPNDTPSTLSLYDSTDT